jgi:hypothetical protein
VVMVLLLLLLLLLLLTKLLGECTSLVGKPT